MVKTYEITAKCDPEAKVWVATSDDVPGLVAEAETYEALLKKLEVMVPELLEANGVLQPNEQFRCRDDVIDRPDILDAFQT